MKVCSAIEGPISVPGAASSTHKPIGQYILPTKVAAELVRVQASQVRKVQSSVDIEDFVDKKMTSLKALPTS